MITFKFGDPVRDKVNNYIGTVERLEVEGSRSWVVFRNGYKTHRIISYNVENLLVGTAPTDLPGEELPEENTAGLWEQLEAIKDFLDVEVQSFPTTVKVVKRNQG